jgi:hypothetical protein
MLCQRAHTARKRTCAKQHFEGRGKLVAWPPRGNDGPEPPWQLPLSPVPQLDIDCASEHLLSRSLLHFWYLPTTHLFTLILVGPPVMTGPLSVLPAGTFPLEFAPTAAAALGSSKRAADGEVVAFKCESCRAYPRSYTDALSSTTVDLLRKFNSLLLQIRSSQRPSHTKHLDLSSPLRPGGASSPLTK